MVFTNFLNLFISWKTMLFPLIVTNNFAISIIHHTEYLSILGWYLLSLIICRLPVQSFLAFMAFIGKSCYSDGPALFEHIYRRSCHLQYLLFVVSTWPFDYCMTWGICSYRLWDLWSCFFIDVLKAQSYIASRLLFIRGITIVLQIFWWKLTIWVIYVCIFVMVLRHLE